MLEEKIIHKKILRKKAFYFFSSHASYQLHSRSTMSRSDVLSLLDKDLYIPVGQDKNHRHLVIYSIKDNEHYVIVHDEKNLEIITFLYVDYNNKFVIFTEPLKEIKEKTIAFKNKSKPFNINTKKSNKKVNQNSKLIVKPIQKDINENNWLFANTQIKPFISDSTYKVVVERKINRESNKELFDLFTFDTKDYENEVKNLDNLEFINKIQEKVEELKIDPLNIIVVSLREIKNGNTIKWGCSKKFNLA